MENHFPPSDWICEQIALEIQKVECFRSGNCRKWSPDFSPFPLSSEGPSMCPYGFHYLRCMKLSEVEVCQVFKYIFWEFPKRILYLYPSHPSCSNTFHDTSVLLIFFPYYWLSHRYAYWVHVTLLLCVLVGSDQSGLNNLPGGHIPGETDSPLSNSYWLPVDLPRGVEPL